MHLLPAIDLKEGRCVRLIQGDMNRTTVFERTPADQARAFGDEGAEWIHIVDLDGAFQGAPVNVKAVEDILKSTNINIELGGGIRSLDTIDRWVDKGVSRVILGTIALKDPDFVFKACERFKGKIAVGIDAKNGLAAVEGWAETSSIKDVDLALKFEAAGVSAIIYTDIARDGVLKGANLEATTNVSTKIRTPVIVSGGISSLDDLRTCKASEHKNLYGVIVGRALYDNRFSVSEALSALK